MTTAIFRRMAERLLAGPLSQGAVLRGNVPCRVNLEHGVEFTGYEADVAHEHVVATLLKSVSPKRGDTLETDNDGSFVLDGPAFQDNGHTVRFVVRKA